MVNAIDVEGPPPLKLSDSDGKTGGTSFTTPGGVSRAARGLLADTVARTAVRIGFLILTWYVFSTALGMFNKKVVGKKYGVFGKGAFPAPLLLTGVQFAFQNLLAKAVFATGLVARVGAPMTWREWGRLVLPNGAVTGLDIGFSNASLVHITMSFYTMCKSTTPIFLLAFAFLMGLETPSWSLAGVVAVIVSGLLLLVQGEADFDATGFVLVMSASCMSGLRFTLTQVLLHGNKGSGSEQAGGKPAPADSHGPSAFGGPLEVLELLTPVMSVTTLLLSLVSERLWATLPASPYFSSPSHCFVTFLIILAGALLAFLMVWAEYQVIKETSALTFMIAGTVKEVVTIVTACIVFGDKFGPLNGLGLVVVIAGVLLFNAYKLSRLKQSVKQRIQEGGEGECLMVAMDVEREGQQQQLVQQRNGSGGDAAAAANGGAASPRRCYHQHHHHHPPARNGHGAAAAAADGATSPADGGSFTRRKSGLAGGATTAAAAAAAAAAGPDSDPADAAQLQGPEHLQALEFEPLLNGGGHARR